MVRRHFVTLVLTLLLVGGAFGYNLSAGNTPALGLDLQGGASVTLTPVGQYETGALDVAVEVIRQRVDSLGVAEPEIIRQGDTVVVNLPGVKDQERALELVGRTGSVEMRPVINVIENPELSPTTTAAGVTATTVAGETTTTVVSDTTLADPAGGLGSSRRASTATTAPPTTDDTTPAPTGDGADENVDVDPNTGLAPGQTVLPSRDGTLLYLLGPAEATGEVFSSDSTAQIDAGQWVVVAQLRSGAAGEDLWNALAAKCFEGGAECPTKSIAIILDGEVMSAPVVQTPNFTGGSVQITGDFSESEAQDLAKILQFGAVPVDFEAPTVQTVSATLGKDSLRAAIISGLIGVALVLLFLLLYYRLIALVVVGGLLVSGMLLWSVIAWLSKSNGLALTISGAAGIIVSIGVTVDSYVVFFEKLKDDVEAGRTLRNSAERGFARAWRTILIADTASLLGAIVLWWWTVGPVRGFAFFLGLSTITDVIVSYLFTRPTVLMLARTNLLNRGSVLGVRRSRTVEVSQ
ncbi:MAG: protein translocase subunit SecD [Ilumatobacteraceae bacterium]